MLRQVLMLGLVVGLTPALAMADDEAAKPAAEGAKVSFLKDLAPIFQRSCVGCHNQRKAESKYDMTTFAKLAKGGAMGEGVTLEAGDPDASYFVELIRHEGQPRMPYKQDPLPLEQVALVEKWVKEGATYDGASPEENWVTVVNRSRPVNIPEKYPIALPITAVTFAANGQTVAASGYHELNSFSVADGAIARRTSGLGERVYDAAYSADGKWAVTASGDPGVSGSAQLWSVKDDGSLELVKPLVVTDDSVFAVAFSPDSTLVASAGADRAIRFFKVENGEQVGIIEDHADWILDLAFSPDGSRLASASRDKTSKVFDVAKKEAIVTFPGHAEVVNAVLFLPDGKLVASAGGDAQVRVWNPDDEAKQVRGMGGFGGPIFGLALTPDGKLLAAGGADKAVRLFDPSNGNAAKTLEGHTDWIYSLSISRDGKTLASGSWDGEVRLWNIAEGKPERTIVAAPGLASPASSDAK